MATVGVRDRAIAGSLGGAHFLLDDSVAPSAGAQPVAQSAAPDLRVMLAWGVAAIGVVVIALLVILEWTSDAKFTSSATTTPVEGLTIFATFFVAAQAIERLLEPISSVLLPASERNDDASKKADEAAAKVGAWEQAPAATKATAKTAAEDALQAAAQAKAKVDQVHHDRAVVFWALATVLAMWASAVLKLYFLRQVGISAGDRWIEILATGLIIGAGTKPLHDLVTMISAKKEQSQAAENEAKV